MLMLQRASGEATTDEECSDPAVLLACALGSANCPAKCAEAENNTDNNPNNAFNGVVAGDLNVAVSTSSNVTSIPNSGIIKVAELAVKASEDIQLQWVSVTRQGLSQNSNLKVWIEKDGKRISSSSSFFGDSKANLTFNNGGYVVKGDETLDLVVSLSGVAAGSELQFKVSDLVSSAKNTTVSPDTTALFRTADYKATSISFVSVNNSDRSYNLADASSLSFGEFKLQNDSPASMEKDVLIKSITFKVEGSIENLTNFKLLRDSKEVSSKYTVDGKSVTFAVNNQLDSGKSASYKITAEVTNIENDGGDNYTFSIRKSEDVIAEEIGSNATAYRVSVNGTLPTLGKTTIKGGNITLTKDANLASTVSADWSYSDVVVAKGTIKVNQAVKFESAYISWDSVTPTTGLNAVLRRAALVIDGKTYQAEIKAEWLSIGSEIYLSKGEHNVELQVSLATQEVVVESTAVSKIKFKAIDKDSFRGGNYTNGDETSFVSSAIAGTIRVSDVNIAKKKISFKKVGPSEDIKLSQWNTDEKVVFAGEITNNEDKTLEINKFVVASITGGTDASTDSIKYWDVYAVLTADGTTSSTYSIGRNSDSQVVVGIDSVTTTVEPGKTVKFEIRIIPSADLKAKRGAVADAYCEGNSAIDSEDSCVSAEWTWHPVSAWTDDTFKFNVSVEGKLDGNDTNSSELKSAKVTATEGSTSTIVANTTDNKLIIKPGVSTKVASFNYNVKNDSKDINSMEFVINGFTADQLDDLTVDFGGSVGAPGLTYVASSVANSKNTYSATTAETWGIVVTFNNVVTLPVANYKVNVYATFNESAIDKSNGSSATPQTKKEFIAVAIDPSSSAAWYTVGETDEMTVANADAASKLSFGDRVAKAYPILSVKDKNTNTSNTRLDLNVRKSNDDANTVNLISLYTVAGDLADWSVVEGTETSLAAISLDANSATVIRNTTPWINVGSIEFSVIDDEGNLATYAGVNAGSDFASLSL